MKQHCIIITLWSLAGASSMLQHGWLDRLVKYHREKFIDDIQRSGVKIDASIEPAPPGYKDSPLWDEESVLRLIALIDSAGGPVRAQFRRAFKHAPSSRRMFYASKDIPSLNQLNDLYYNDMVSSSEEGVAPIVYDRAVVVVRNPVEARLPSATISVQLLKEIMEARAAAARGTPLTTRYTATWIPKINSTSTITTTSVTTTTTTTGSGVVSSTTQASTSTDGAVNNTSTTAKEQATEVETTPATSTVN